MLRNNARKRSSSPTMEGFCVAPFRLCVVCVERKGGCKLAKNGKMCVPFLLSFLRKRASAFSLLCIGSNLVKSGLGAFSSPPPSDRKKRRNRQKAGNNRLLPLVLSFLHSKLEINPPPPSNGRRKTRRREGHFVHRRLFSRASGHIQKDSKRGIIDYVFFKKAAGEKGGEEGRASN